MCSARTRALADEVYLLVAQRLPRRLEVIDPLRYGVAGEVDAVCRQAGRAGAEAVGVGPERRLSEHVRRVFQCGVNLGAVEHGRSIDAPVTDQDDVMVSCEAARRRELHVRGAGTALQTENRLGRVGGCGSNANDGQRDQSRVRVRPILGHDQRAAVGAGAPLLGRIGAGRELQLAGMRSGGDRHRAGAARQSEVHETEHPQCDEDESDDARRSEAPPPFVCSTAHGMLLS